jgi:hypothetical protein
MYGDRKKRRTPKLAGHVTPGENSEVRTGDPKVRVTSSAVKHAVAVGDNFLSEMYRATVTTVGDDQLEDRSLIASERTVAGGKSNVLQFKE